MSATFDPGRWPRLVALLTGRWEGTEKLYLIPDAPYHRPANSHMSYTPVLSGSALLLDYTQLIGGKVTVRGHGLMTWEPDSGEIRLRWADSGHGEERRLRGPLSGHTMMLSTAEPPALTVTWVLGPGESHLTLWEQLTDRGGWTKRTAGNFRVAGQPPMHRSNGWRLSYGGGSAPAQS